MKNRVSYTTEKLNFLTRLTCLTNNTQKYYVTDTILGTRDTEINKPNCCLPLRGLRSSIGISCQMDIWMHERQTDRQLSGSDMFYKEK